MAQKVNYMQAAFPKYSTANAELDTMLRKEARILLLNLSPASDKLVNFWRQRSAVKGVSFLSRKRP